MKKEFSHGHAVAGQVLLKVANVLKTFFPDVFRDQFGGQLLLFEELGMHPYDQRFFVIAAIKNSYVPSIRQDLHAPPQIIVIEIFG
jgi:hypothetical protein